MNVPAVTVSDITVLPRVDAGLLLTGLTGSTGASKRARRVKSVTTAPQGFEGEGFPVRRAFAGVDLMELDPFIHLDQMGEVEYAPGEPKGTPWHPHRGFETVTYIIDGIFDHKDNHGGGGTITNGDTQWMTAGAGILHIETPPEHLVMSGGLFHGFQLWVNLPAAKKWSKPAYQDIRASQVGLLASHDGGALLRVIAGSILGLENHAGPGSTQTPMTMIHATIAPGAELRLPWRSDYNSLVYTLNGHGTAGEERQPIHSGQLAVLETTGNPEGDLLVIRADQNQESRSPSMDVLILGGLPIREQIAWMGPFVMNTKAEVLKAFEDFQKGLLGTVPAEHQNHQVQKPLHRTDKLGADVKKDAVDSAKAHDVKQVLGVHNAPTELQEGNN